MIVNDFIDMRKEKHRRGLERAMRDALKRDRARTKILRTSPFGLIEMTRQRIRPSLKRSVYADCPCCNGRGVVKTDESMSIEVVRMLMLSSQQPNVARVTVRVNDKVASYLNNKKRKEINQLETGRWHDRADSGQRIGVPRTSRDRMPRQGRPRTALAVDVLCPAKSSGGLPQRDDCVPEVLGTARASRTLARRSRSVSLVRARPERGW